MQIPFSVESFTFNSLRALAAVYRRNRKHVTGQSNQPVIVTYYMNCNGDYISYIPVCLNQIKCFTKPPRLRITLFATGWRPLNTFFKSIFHYLLSIARNCNSFRLIMFVQRICAVFINTHAIYSIARYLKISV